MLPIYHGKRGADHPQRHHYPHRPFLRTLQPKCGTGPEPVQVCPPAGAVDPATQKLDFFIRIPETDERNNPTRRVCSHFFAMEVTWK